MNENPNNGNNGADPVFQPMLDFWKLCVEQNQEYANTLAQSLRDAGDASQWIADRSTAAARHAN